MDKTSARRIIHSATVALGAMVENFLKRAENNDWRMFRGKRLPIFQGLMKKADPIKPATYHRVRDAKRAIVRCHRWHRSNPVAKVGSEPRHIRENYDFARRQLAAAGVLSAR